MGKVGRREGTNSVISICWPLGNIMRRGEGKRDVWSESCFTTCGEIMLT